LALADPKFAARIADLGGVPFATSPSEFRTFIAEFTAKWSTIIKGLIAMAAILAVMHDENRRGRWLSGKQAVRPAVT